MLVNLVNKYGVIPKSTFPESSSSEAALLMNKFLRTKVYLFIEKICMYVFLFFWQLRGYAQEIFELSEQKDIQDSDFIKREAEMMKEVRFYLMI